MFGKLVILQLLVFIVVFIFVQAIIKLLERYLLIRKYKLTKWFSHFAACVIMLMMGIIFGREIFYNIL